MVEVKSRGAAFDGTYDIWKLQRGRYGDFSVYVPKQKNIFRKSCDRAASAYGYYVSVAKGLDVDKPRNLAKSVTVEE